MLKSLLKIALAVIIALALLSAACVIIANAVFPEKIRQAAAAAISRSTGADCRIARVRFHFFKGLVARDIIVSRQGNTLLSVEEVSLRPELTALFSGRLVIGSLAFTRPSLRFELHREGVEGVVLPLPIPAVGKGKQPPFMIKRVSIEKGKLYFVDRTRTPAFTKTLAGIDFDARLSSDAKVKFSFDAGADSSPFRVKASGKLDVSSVLFTCRGSVAGLSASDILPYWPVRGVALKNGIADTDFTLEFKEGILKLRADSRVHKAEFAWRDVKAVFDSGVTFKLGKAFKAPPVYTLECAVDRAVIDTGGPLGAFSFSGPVELSGSAFSWRGLKAERAGQDYVTAGSLKDFSSPQIDFTVVGADTLDVEGHAKTENRVMTISYLKGRFRGSTVSVTGTVDLGKKSLASELSSLFDIELADLRTFFKDAPLLEKAKPAGTIAGQAKFSGSLRDMPNAVANASFKGGPVSAWGLTLGSAFADYRQENGRAKIMFSFSAYNGLSNNEADIELAPPDHPFALKAKLDGLDLEKLKGDTTLKDKELSGSLSGQAGFSGTLSAPKDCRGQGALDISKGKLLQLDVLAGLGQLLFPELGTVTFDHGHCDFTLKDRTMSTENLSLTSRTVVLAGKGSLGLDGTVDAFMNLQVSDMLIPRLGKLRDLAGLVLKQTGRIVGVKITGTRQQPKYAIEQPLVMDVWKSLKGLLNAMGKTIKGGS